MKATIFGLALSAFAALAWAQGMDFRTYLSIQRGMSEGEMLANAGRPDLVSEQGFGPETTLVLFDRTHPPAPCGQNCAMRTYTWLPTDESPHTTTVTIVGGRVTEIERNQRF